ncbi:hypothetical protein FRB90_006472, partial [Tulasnella sp. 427]
YVIPGGPVVLQGGPGYYGGSMPTATPTTTTTTSKATGSTTTTKSGTTTTTASGAQQTAYGQCGGQGWTGATNCVSGYTCKYSNAYYSQCLPS